jgi:hypothetical protein
MYIYTGHGRDFPIGVPLYELRVLLTEYLPAQA